MKSILNSRDHSSFYNIIEMVITETSIQPKIIPQCFDVRSGLELNVLNTRSLIITSDDGVALPV